MMKNQKGTVRTHVYSTRRSDFSINSTKNGSVTRIFMSVKICYGRNFTHKKISAHFRDRSNEIHLYTNDVTVYMITF